ncbi:Na+/H+ antiporter NhaC [Flammeovirga yaeyamensis]|uniref:Na+/H+ antiporter NhaC n=1 Tax=Flammeovirga yaeyamensis TaxID=367791 RepID=A0AAX1N831_9BACT|nr:MULTISPECIES: Na+/H+ antiporter NhaC [Flammeovirga]ANQ50392.1 Na+/H+ antiporter NhaC [Flammeovirga sp. MY04]MBB3699651.1 NhaC family Na+:H+ antiporter [Flammeovirga yaeyamensis]NMF36778.1 Na+/H+ antiporter NhaC [Flammeovirga yaeyamensis]QWG02182.1 Na+/H+ antiporter NhaC [Flammeovirga yaeyamensis]
MNLTHRKPSFLDSILPIIFLVVLLGLNVTVFKDTGLDGSNQIALLLSTAVVGVIAFFKLKISFDTLLDGVVNSISSAMSSILILLMIGALSGAWLFSGIVPTMVYYGLQILNPSIFLFATIIICAIVSVATGSSWSTIATVGIALLGIGTTLNLPEGIVAGAIISGAYFGDKMSPLSDTTNLAPAVAGTDLFTHIRYMVYTTVPSFGIAAVIFLIMGFTYDTKVSPENVESVLTALEQSFHISPVLFIVPAVVVFMIIKKVPALPALFIGALAGVVIGILYQPKAVEIISASADDYLNVEGWKSFYFVALKSMYGGFEIESENMVVTKLLKSGGMAGMLNTIWLIITAMTFGGAMEVSGMLEKITSTIISKVTSETGLFASVAGTCVFFNFTASDQYLSIVVPGKMYAKAFKEKGLAPENLSRTLEDTATVTSVLVPWNTCGVAQSTVLQVPTVAYLPYCFFNILSPLMTLLFAALKIRISRIGEDKE